VPIEAVDSFAFEKFEDPSGISREAVVAATRQMLGNDAHDSEVLGQLVDPRNATITCAGVKWFVSIQTRREVDVPLPRGKVRAEAAIKAIEQAPDNQAVQQEQQRSKQCQDIFGQRQAARHSHGKSSETLRSAPTNRRPWCSA
jgi:hypothetical protein